MEDDWESVANKPIVIPDNINKWAGEDEDEDVKDSWDIEEEEEKKDEEKSDTTNAKTPIKTKPNKALKSKLAEQERLEDEAEAARIANMTPEEKLAEKLRLQKIQEESDLKSALETFGVTDVDGGLDTFNPQTEEEFKEFGTTLSWKLSQYKESPHYSQFIEDLVRSIGVHLSISDLKKLKISVENLHTEKLKLEKQNAKKPAGKAKGKISLKTEGDDIDGYKKYGNDYNTYDDYDDFM